MLAYLRPHKHDCCPAPHASTSDYNDFASPDFGHTLLAEEGIVSRELLTDELFAEILDQLAAALCCQRMSEVVLQSLKRGKTPSDDASVQGFFFLARAGTGAEAGMDARAGAASGGVGRRSRIREGCVGAGRGRGGSRGEARCRSSVDFSGTFWNLFASGLC